MKAFFGFLLVVSILVPFYGVFSGLQVTAHNQYEGRFNRLKSTESSEFPSLHLGLTAGELAALGRDTAYAYTDAVDDGYRLGRGYEVLWLEFMALDGLLLLCSLFGLWACRLRRQSPNQAMQTCG